MNTDCKNPEFVRALRPTQYWSGVRNVAMIGQNERGDMKRTKMRTGGGFTLIELMAVVLIIGILSMIAYPAYTRYIMQTRRSDAYNALSQLANNLEKFYSTCSAYTTDIKSSSSVNCTNPAAGPGTLGLGPSGDQSPNGYYTLSIVTAGAGVPPGGGYLIIAQPNNPGPQAQDSQCSTITLDSTGGKHAKDSSSNDTSSVCWKS